MVHATKSCQTSCYSGISENIRKINQSTTTKNDDNTTNCLPNI